MSMLTFFNWDDKQKELLLPDGSTAGSWLDQANGSTNLHQTVDSIEKGVYTNTGAVLYQPSYPSSSAGKQRLISVWAYQDVEVWEQTKQILRILDASNNDVFEVNSISGGRMQVTAENSSGVRIFNWYNVSGDVVVKQWFHLLVSFDLETGAAHYYLNDVAAINSPITLTNDTIPASDKLYVLAANVAISNWNGGVAHLYVEDTYLDLSVEANRRHFITADKKPADISNYGNPNLRLTKGGLEFGSNSGSGPDIPILVGGLSVPPILPSDADYIKSPINPSNSATLLTLANPVANRQAGEVAVIKFRYRQTASTSMNLKINLKQGSTIIATVIRKNVPTGFFTDSFGLTVAQTAAITDWNALTIQILASVLEFPYFDLNPNDLSTLWQDTAGTNPVTATGQEVKRIDDAAGGSVYFTAPTLGAVLQQAANGQNYLDFSGAGTRAYVSTEWDTTDVGVLSAVTAIESTGHTQSIIYEQSNDFNITTNAPSFVCYYENNTIGWVSGHKPGDTSYAVYQSLMPITTPVVLSIVHDLSGNTLDTEIPYFRINEVNAKISPTGTYSNQAPPVWNDFQVYLGARGGTSLSFKGRIYRLRFFKEALDLATLYQEELTSWKHIL